ncbi:MAG: matrixin family metalloprotease [Candidatus Wallbacteria bacterium]|nr:matrixin family metalloprotease [Candidatus Wallbacteria bacterium]
MVLLLLVCAAQGAALAWNQNADAANPELRVKWGQVPIPYRINPSTASGNVSVGDTSAADAVRAAFRTWDDAASANVSFRDEGDTLQETASTQEGVNLVSFVDVAFPYGGALAVTPYSYSTQNGALRYASVLFNPQVRFSTASEPGTFDVQAVATHEIGHLLGLDHSAILASTMLPFGCKDSTRGRHLSPDDLAGISSIYPALGFQAATGSIVGRVTNAAGSSIFGAHLVAVSSDGVVGAGAYTAADGSYRIGGLPPGAYQVLLEPLDGPVTTTTLSSPAYAFNFTRLASDFSSAFFQGGALVVVSAGFETSGIDFRTAPRTSQLDLRKLAMLPQSASSAEPVVCATDAQLAVDGQNLIVAGPGLNGSVSLSVSGAGVQLTFRSAFTLSDGTPAVRYLVEVSATAALGARNLVATDGQTLSVLAGALVVTPPTGDELGPTLSCSYDREPAAVPAGQLRISLLSDELLSTRPRISIDRPGTGNDVTLALLSPGATGFEWTYLYDVARASAPTISDGPCSVTVTAARDLAGNELRGLTGGSFTVDTQPPTGAIVYSKPASGVGAGILVLTASFSEPLGRAPRVYVDRPGTGNDAGPETMAPTGSPSQFTYAYSVAQAAPTVSDGVAVVFLDSIVDRAGNAGLQVSNTLFTLDTTPPAWTLAPRLRFTAAPVGVLSIDLTVTEPLSTVPLLSIDRPGSGNDVLDAPMSATASGLTFTLNYIVLPADGTRILDGSAQLRAMQVTDAAGNTAAPSVTLPVDTVPPNAVLSYSQPAGQVPAGRLVLTATFNEPLARTPSVEVDRPGEGNDLLPTPMTSAGDLRVWTASYQVLKQDGVDVRDGLASVTLRGALDSAGNVALTPAGGVLVFATGPEPPVARLSLSSSALSRIPAGPLFVTATFNLPPSERPLRLLRTPPGTGFSASGVSSVVMTATSDPNVYIAQLELPVANGVNVFDGLQSLQVTFPDGKPVTTLGGKFRSLTLDSLGKGHVALSLPRGSSLIALPLSAPGSGPGGAYMAGDLARSLGATLVVRTAPGGNTPNSRFEVYLASAGAADFPLEGNRSYLVHLPAAATLQLDGQLWPTEQRTTSLSLGANWIALPLGSPAGYGAGELARDTGASGILRQRRTSSGTLAFEPYLDGLSAAFNLELEDGLLLLSPSARPAVLPAGP